MEIDFPAIEKAKLLFCQRINQTDLTEYNPTKTKNKKTISKKYKNNNSNSFQHCDSSFSSSLTSIKKAKHLIHQFDSELAVDLKYYERHLNQVHQEVAKQYQHIMHILQHAIDVDDESRNPKPLHVSISTQIPDQEMYIPNQEKMITIENRFSSSTRTSNSLSSNSSKMIWVVDWNNKKIVQQSFKMWQNASSQCQKQQQFWQKKIHNKVEKTHLLLHQCFDKFEAQEIFSREGKHVMATEYKTWRMKRVAFAKWMMFMSIKNAHR